MKPGCPSAPSTPTSILLSPESSGWTQTEHRGHRLMTYCLLLLGRGYLCQPPLNSGHSSFPRNRPREGGGQVQGHTGVWTRAAGVLPRSRLAQEPRIPWQGGSSAHVAQGPGGNPTSSLPPSPSPRAAPSPAQRSAPLRWCLAGPQPLAPRPQPQEFNPFPAQDRVKAPHSQPAGTPRRGRGDPARAKIPHTPPRRDDRLFAREGRAGRWADKWGDRQGLAYHGAVALGAHRAPRDRAAPGGQAGAAPCSAALGAAPAQGPATMAPGGAAGRAEAQGRGESSRRAAAAPEPQARRAGGAGRRLEPARQLGPPSGRLKGQAALRAGGGADTRGARRPGAASPASGRRGLRPGPAAPILEDGPWTHSLAPSPLSARKFIPESNLGALQMRHRGGVIGGGGPKMGKLGAPAPTNQLQKRLTPAPLSDLTLRD